MNFTGTPAGKLTNTEIENIKELFSEFYREHADSALPGQVDFMDSVYDQFNERNYLSERQIEGMRNIIDSCLNTEDCEIDWRNQ